MRNIVSIGCLWRLFGVLARCHGQQRRNPRSVVCPGNPRRGMALVAAVLFMAMLIGLFYRFVERAGVQVRLESRWENELQARLIARAGLAVALGTLFQDRSLTDSLQEPWALLAEQTGREPLKIGGGECRVSVSDEWGKINVNMAAEEELLLLFRTCDLGIVHESELLGETISQDAPDRLAQRILDYRDADDQCRPLGLEKEDYPVGFPPRNGPLTAIDELLNIPGVTPDLLVASGTRPGLRDILTVQSEGYVNLNTVSRSVLEGIPGPPNYGPVARRTYFDALCEALPFQRVGAYADFLVDYDPWMARSYTDRFVTFSRFFRIEAIATLGDIERRLVGWVSKDRQGRCHLQRMVEIP